MHISHSSRSQHTRAGPPQCFLPHIAGCKCTPRWHCWCPAFPAPAAPSKAIHTAQQWPQFETSVGMQHGTWESSRLRVRVTSLAAENDALRLHVRQLLQEISSQQASSEASTLLLLPPSPKPVILLVSKSMLLAACVLWGIILRLNQTYHNAI